MEKREKWEREQQQKYTEMQTKMQEHYNAMVEDQQRKVHFKHFIVLHVSFCKKQVGTHVMNVIQYGSRFV
jgi:hypothetical protein